MAGASPELADQQEDQRAASATKLEVGCVPFSGAIGERSMVWPLALMDESECGLILNKEDVNRDFTGASDRPQDRTIYIRYSIGAEKDVAEIAERMAKYHKNLDKKAQAKENCGVSPDLSNREEAAGKLAN
jgi:hypothetical protein